MISVWILDDHVMVTRGVVSMLQEAVEIGDVKAFNTYADLQQALASTVPQVMLLDINMPDINGMEVCANLRSLYPTMGIIGLSNYDDTAFIKNMMRNGANGYLLKNTEREELVRAIQAVQNGESYLPTKIRDWLINESIGSSAHSSFIPKLSRREQEVLQLIAEEQTSSEIAESLFISVKTVESHRKNLFQKFNVKNTAGLVRQAIRTGLLNA